MIVVAEGLEVAGPKRGDLVQPWHSTEVVFLRQNAHLGVGALAGLLGRSVRSVKQAAYRHRISLRPPGERRGTVLGQPRGTSFLDARAAGARVQRLRVLREAALAGIVDPVALERRVRLLVDGAPLCPGCAMDPIEVETTGLCRACHLDALAEAHRAEMRVHAAQRALWVERQRKVRSRREREP